MPTTKKSLSHFSKRNARPAKNEEWGEIVGVDVGGEQKVRMATQPKHPTPVNVKHISTGDLLNMKKKDSFAYYSIPGVRRAKLMQTEIDLENLGTPGLSLRRGMSCPSRLHSRPSTNAKPQTVLRRSRLSFECHPDVFEEEENGGAIAACIEENDEDIESSDDEAVDPLAVLLESMVVKN